MKVVVLFLLNSLGGLPLPQLMLAGNRLGMSYFAAPTLIPPLPELMLIRLLTILRLKEIATMGDRL